jgi:cbb3-type cytochrome c oxidase subunit III
MFDRGFRVTVALLGGAMMLAACNRAPTTATNPPPADSSAALVPLASVATDDVAKTPEHLAIAMREGRTLYDAHCASCHGADLKGLPDKHTPDLTDDIWIYSGDDLDTGGIVHRASDVEKTILYGIRARPQVTNLGSQQANDAANLKYKNLAVMRPFGPDKEYALTEDEIADVAEYTLLLSGQQHDPAKAMRGQAIFADKGSCYDCHGQEGEGDQAIGSTNLQKPALYLYGSSREAILASLKQGRGGVMPGFEGVLKPDEIKAVAVYTFSQGGPGSFPGAEPTTPAASAPGEPAPATPAAPAAPAP